MHLQSTALPLLLPLLHFTTAQQPTISTVTTTTTSSSSDDNDSPYFAPAFSHLPSPLQSYLSSQATGTSLADAVIGDYVTEPEDALADDGSHGPVYSEAVPFVQGALTRFEHAATATAFALVPDQAAVLRSVVGVIGSVASEDGVLGTGRATGTGMGAASTTGASSSGSVGGVMTMASASGSGSGSGSGSMVAAKTAASTTTSSNAAVVLGPRAGLAGGVLQAVIMGLVGLVL